MAVCTQVFTSLLFFAPKYWLIITAKPEAIPTKKPTKRFTMVPVLPPTAANASFPTKFPTITASAVLYNCCKTEPNKIGKKKIRSCFIIFPCVTSTLVLPLLLIY